ncbi:MAG TPA: hypothetical protein PLW40_10195 [Syntrophales bacterium]|nr:hypothetical protein [Syntrophales bacterium]
MRKFWVTILALGLVAAFAMPAAAVDVKFTGQYYVQGWYVDNVSLLDKNEVSTNTDSWKANAQRGCAALYSQRFRLQTEFKVAEGLTLVTRFDALEKVWGSANWRGGTGETQTRRAMITEETTTAVSNAQENIEFERVYLDMNTAIGKFQIGYQQFLMWGTDFLNTPLTAPGIRYLYTTGPLTLIAAIEKRNDFAGSNYGNTNSTTSNIGRANDGDHDVYDLGFIYKFKPGEVGLMYQYGRNAWNKPPTTTDPNAADRYLTQVSIFLPYAKLNFGNFFIEGEGLYATGEMYAYEPRQLSGGSPNQDVNCTQWGLFLHGKYTFKPAYVGLQFVYLSGDDMDADDKITGSLTQAFTAGYGFDRTLILWNSAYGDTGFGARATGATGGIGNVITNTNVNPRTKLYNYPYYYMDNCWFYQGYVGVNPLPKMDVRLALSYAVADKKPRENVGPVSATNKEFVSDKIGTELDLIATYKIFDNLEYMLGAGYLWTGDYFKGFDTNNVVKDNYIITHKLTLNF